MLLLGSLVGFRGLLRNETLTIQLHNTFFVVAVRHLTVPLFLLLALPGTGVRAALARFRRRATNVVLAGLVGLSLLLLAPPALWLWQGLHRGGRVFCNPTIPSGGTRPYTLA